VEHHSVQSLFSALFSFPYGFLLFGIACFANAAFATNSGRVWLRFRWAYRTQEPKTFWWDVVLYYVAGASFIVYFLYLGTTVGYPPLW
jgi:hypothetical protein